MAVSGADIVKFALQFKGTPYVWGGNDLRKGVDCSGLVQQVYKNFGINVSRTTYSQIGEGKAVKMNELQAGDMVFFDTNPRQKGPDHVGIYIGNGQVLHAPRPGAKVRVEKMETMGGAFMGGRRMPAIQGGGTAEDWETAPGGEHEKLSPEELAASYGWAYSFLNSIPELRTLFTEAVDQTWSQDMFQAKLRDTKWFKDNSADMRRAALEKTTDPATWNAKVGAAKIQIMQLAAQMGASIPMDKLNKIVEQAVTLNMDEAGLKNVLGGYVTFNEKGYLGGQAAMFEKNMRGFAYAQGVEINRETLKSQAQLLARGLATEQDFKDQIVNQAISTFPNYAQQLQAGVTMMEIASPYIQRMAEDLELPYTKISLRDPLVRQALNGTNKEGKPVGMDSVAFQNLIRQDPRWKMTGKAQNNVLTAGLTVLRDMGLSF